MVPYRVERSARLKRMYLQVNAQRMVVLKIPQRSALNQGLDFLRANGEWIRDSLTRQPATPLLLEHLQRSHRISAHGAWVPLSLGYHAGLPQFECGPYPERVRLLLPQFEEAVLVKLLRRCAAEVLPARLKDLAHRHRLKPHGVQIRDQQQRWGSCSETGSISLNWRLILLPPRVQDHVLLHELAHLQHFDHSAAFHQFLGRLDPNSDHHSGELNRLTGQFIHMGR